MIRKTIPLLCCALAFPLGAAARGGDLDPTFGQAGSVAIAGGPVAFALQPDGKAVTVTSGTSQQQTLVRHLAGGQPDPSFQGGPITIGGSVQAVAIGPEGAILVAGSTSDVCNRLFVARFDAQGRHDTSFGTDGLWRSACRIYPFIGARVAALPDGRIAAFGDSYWFQSMSHSEPVIARLDAGGQLDPTYGDGGYARAPFDSIYDGPGIAFAADGSIEFVRYTWDFTERRYRVQSSRLRADGSVDRTPSGAAETSLDRWPVATDSFDVLMLRDGTRLLVGAGSARAGIVAYGRDHQVVGTFGDGGHVDFAVAAKFPHPRIQHAHRAADGGLLLVVSDIYGVEDYELVKLDARGAMDPTFGTGGRKRISVVPGQEAHLDAGMQPDGYAVLAGATFSANGWDKTWLARMQVVGDVVEFRNTLSDHYFLTLDGDEARGIDAGVAGPGWQRTGQSWKAGGPTPVCRFYAPGPSSHFFTSDAGECEAVKRMQGWGYEGLGFYVTPAQNRACAAPLQPVRRLYNNRYFQNDSNHRYVVDASLVPAMTARGWTDEGIVFCVTG